MRLRGFSLIELLVIISIFGILASLAAYGYSNSLKRSRDSQRMADLMNINNALEQYYLDNRDFPDTETNNGIALVARVQLENSFNCNFSPNKTFLAPRYLISIPEDPQTRFTPGGGPSRCGANLAGQYLYFLKDPARSEKGFYLAARVELERNITQDLDQLYISNPPETRLCSRLDCDHNYLLVSR